jgi:hypothetical protein
VITVELARRLRSAGLAWAPVPGDRFVVEQPELLDQPFVVSDMTVDVHEFPTGRVIGFNGTTEWALDSVVVEQTLWLPTEEQLRTRLGSWFARLERDGDGHRVVLHVDGAERAFAHADATEAYGRALLHLLAEGHLTAG